MHLIQKYRKVKTIGNYTLGKTLGKGAFAHVREGVHQITSQKVAIKIIDKRLFLTQKQKLSLCRQLKIIRKLRHPCIAQHLQTIQTSSKLYLVTQLATQSDLYTFILNTPKSRLSQQKAAKLFQQLIQTVSYVHSLKICHRDIKCQNILLSQGNIKLIDFGLSCIYQEGQVLNQWCGSLCYSAPEVLMREQYDPLSVDIWSCGIVLYTMLCGFLPFQQTDINLLYKKVKQLKYCQPNHLSTQAKDLISKLLKINPKERINLEQIKSHPFCYPLIDPICGLIPSDVLKLEQVIVQEMKNARYTEIQKEVQKHKNSETTAVYYMLLYKKLKQQQTSLISYFKLSARKGLSIYRSKSLMIKKYPQNKKTVNKRKNSTSDNEDSPKYTIENLMNKKLIMQSSMSNNLNNIHM